MKLNIADLRYYSIANRTQIQAQERCACYYCIKIYQSNLIVEWHLEKRGQYKGEETAICPFCGIDSVIQFEHSFHEEIDISFLKSARDYWFHNNSSK